MQEMLDSAHTAGALHFWTPLLPGPHVRVLYVATDLLDEIRSDERDPYRMGQLHRDFDRFCQGGLITIGYGRESRCLMKPLDPRADEVWELRSRDPRPQVRVFGRFAAPDVFVATNAEYRDELGEPDLTRWEGNNWPAEILRCKARWRVLVPGQAPIRGDSIHDYITVGAVEVGRLP